MSNDDFKKRITEYKKSTGYSDATPDQRKAIADDLIKKMKCFDNLDNKRLTDTLYKIRREQRYE